MKKEEQQSKLKLLYNKLVNRETVTYVISGVLTTIVNFVSYHISCNILLIPNLISNVIAWVLAVTFAYVVNDKFVFLSSSKGIRENAVKATKFYGARLLTLGVEELGMFLFVDWLGFYNLAVKAAMAVIVIILNYILSKIFIFNKQ